MRAFSVVLLFLLTLLGSGFLACSKPVDETPAASAASAAEEDAATASGEEEPVFKGDFETGDASEWTDEGEEEKNGGGEAGDG